MPRYSFVGKLLNNRKPYPDYALSYWMQSSFL